MFSVLALAALEPLLNHWIDSDAATRQRLDQLAGKTLRIALDSPVLSVDVLFDTGRLHLTPTPLGQGSPHTLFEQRPYDRRCAPTSADATLHLPTAAALLQLLMRPKAQGGSIPIQGDFKVLQVLQQALSESEPDLAGQVHIWFGPVVAGEVARILTLGRTALQRSVLTVPSHADEWLREDSGLLASRTAWSNLTAHTRQLRTDAERLSARLSALRASLAQQS